MKINKYSIIAALVLVLLLTSLSSWLLMKNETGLSGFSFQKMNQPLPEIDLLSIGDQEGALPDTAFLLVVWATWCPACVAEHPYLIEIAKDIPLIGLVLRDEESKVTQFLAAQGNPFVHNFNDIVGSYSQTIGVQGTPTIFFVDKEATIRARLLGGLNERKWVDKKLQQFAAQL